MHLLSCEKKRKKPNLVVSCWEHLYMISCTYKNKNLLYFGMKICNIYFLIVIQMLVWILRNISKCVIACMLCICMLEFILYQYYSYSVLCNYHLQGRYLANSSCEENSPYSMKWPISLFLVGFYCKIFQAFLFHSNSSRCLCILFLYSSKLKIFRPL